MKTKTKQELLAAYKRANKKARIRIWTRAGYADMILAGEERVLTGRLTTTELDDLGYARMIDLKIPKPATGYDNRLRNINPRNINWMIVNNVKYQIK